MEEKTTCVLNLNKCSKKDILDSFLNTYHLYEVLFTGIKDEKYFYMAPDRLRLPLIFYYAHTATLYVNKMILSGLIETRINYKFEKLFETGVDEMSWDDTENYRMGGAFEWPSLQEVTDYRFKVKEMVINVVEATPLSSPINRDHPLWSLLMGIAHERLHLETTSVLLRQMPREYLQCPSVWRYAPSMAADPVESNEFITVEEGDAVLGKPQDFPSFGWDYEYGRAEIRVPKFEATKYTITNGEFLKFVEAGGYENETLWSKEGWEWVQFKQAKHPLFWICHRNCKSGCGSSIPAEYSHCTLAPPTVGNHGHSTYKYRAVFNIMEIPLDWPVDVNFHEAKAYCKWRGPDYRLLTQSEHIRIRGQQPPTCDFECDEPVNSIEKYNVNLTFGSSSPVNYFPPNKLGFHDVFGNVYQWVEDHINGYLEFATDYLYDDMSNSYFDGRHNVIMGSSWATSGDAVSQFSRNWFRRHFFQHAGFRLARTLTNQPSPVMLCQADFLFTNQNNNDHLANSPPGVQALRSFLQPKNPQFKYDRISVCEETTLTHMGTRNNFGSPLVSFCERILSEQGIVKNRAVVFGCGPGYSCFLLTKSFNQVIGVDYGGRLIATANEFKTNGYITLSNGHQFKLPFTDIHPDRAIFKQFTWVPNELDEFNLVLFESLDRFNNPKGWLLKLRECLLPGGVVITSSSSNWGSQALMNYFTKWFNLIEETSLFSNNAVTAWKLK